MAHIFVIHMINPYKHHSYTMQVTCIHAYLESFLSYNEDHQVFYLWINVRERQMQSLTVLHPVKQSDSGRCKYWSSVGCLH